MPKARAWTKAPQGSPPPPPQIGASSSLGWAEGHSSLYLWQAKAKPLHQNRSTLEIEAHACAFSEGCRLSVQLRSGAHPWRSRMSPRGFGFVFVLKSSRGVVTLTGTFPPTMECQIRRWLMTPVIHLSTTRIDSSSLVRFPCALGQRLSENVCRV